MGKRMALELQLTLCHHEWLAEELLQCQRHKSHLSPTSVILHSFNYLFTHSFPQHYLLSVYNLLCTKNKIRSEKCTQSLPSRDIKHVDSVTYSISTSRGSTLCCSRHLVIVNNSPGSVVFTCKPTLAEPTPCHLLWEALTHRLLPFCPHAPRAGTRQLGMAPISRAHQNDSNSPILSLVTLLTIPLHGNHSHVSCPRFPLLLCLPFQYNADLEEENQHPFPNYLLSKTSAPTPRPPHLVNLYTLKVSLHKQLCSQRTLPEFLP